MHFSGNTKICFFLKQKSSNFFMGFKIHFFLKNFTLEMVKNSFSQKRKCNLNFERKMRYLTKNAIFEIFYKFLVKARKLIFLITITLKCVVFAPKISAKFLTVKMQVLQKFVYQLF